MAEKKRNWDPCFIRPLGAMGDETVEGRFQHPNGRFTFAWPVRIFLAGGPGLLEKKGGGTGLF